MNPEEFVCVRIDSALEEVKKILGKAHNHKLPADVDTKYDEKDCLTEFLMNAIMAANLNALERMGIDEQKLGGGKNSVTLWFDAEETCTLVEEKNKCCW